MDGDQEKDGLKLADGASNQDLQKELQYFLENRLDGLLAEAEKLRVVKGMRRAGTRQLRKKTLHPDKGQRNLPFLWPLPERSEEDIPFSKVSGEEL
ncbi:hypothetical protein LEP1GSC050_0940 [Leptospira broomii serovar Hurstbridge str. 5399]|uniref:Uncharacterized protein n=2 Tax=Leptospira broomii TaxID=301541 RepID=T0GKG2_9LEPT|nr:hypothetical protein LEP1GSC050_0940 [Leptospira broomii serovar Hurstbridge str. 5399]